MAGTSVFMSAFDRVYNKADKELLISDDLDDASIICFEVVLSDKPNDGASASMSYLSAILCEEKSEFSLVRNLRDVLSCTKQF